MLFIEGQNKDGQNHNRWKDLVAYPVERKKAVDKLREKMAANCKYYYTRLANGEILRVVGCSTLEAKEMIMAVERKDIIPRYKEYNTKLALTDEPRDASTGPTAIVNYDPEKYVMWVIKFDNGEACYAFGLPDYSDKEDIMEAAVKSREAMVEYYKKIVYRDEDNKEKKKQKHAGIDTEKDEDSEQVKRLFKVPKIDDMVQIENPATYKIINETNFKEFTEPRTSPLTWEPAGKTYYNIKIGELGDIILPLKDEAEVKAVLGRITDLGGAFAQKIREYATEIVNNNVSYYQCVNGTNSYFYIPYVSASTGDALDTGTANEAKNRATELFNIIGEIITNNNAEMKESLISPGTIKAYNTDYAPKRAARVCKPAGTEINSNGDTIEHYTADWPTKIKYQQFDSRSNDSLTEVIEYKDAKADTTWPTRTRRNAEQQTNTTTDASSNAI